jgi:hypothetical protein
MWTKSKSQEFERPDSCVSKRKEIGRKKEERRRDGK